MKNTVRGGQIMARYRYIWKAEFPNFVTVIRPRVPLTCMKRNRCICLFWFIFLWWHFICSWLLTSHRTVGSFSLTNNALQRPHKANGLRTRHALNDSCSAAPHYFGKKGASCKKCSQIGTCTCQQRHLTRLRMRSNSESDDRRTKTRASHLIYDTTGNRNARFSLPEQIRVQASSTHAHRLLRVKKKKTVSTPASHICVATT